jgi:beta-glucanase (GH16 family)
MFRRAWFVAAVPAVALGAATSARADHLPPPSPGSVSAITASSAYHDWGSVPKADYYFAYLYNAAGQRIGRVQARRSKYTWTALSACTQYYSNATAYDRKHESARSSWLPFKTTCPPAPTPTPTPSPAPSPPTWSDEFNGPAGAPPDAANWTLRTGGGGWGNQELQCYTRRPENASMDGVGVLHIVARRESDGTLCNESNSYTSARMDTKAKRQFQYGRFEARMKLPKGAGLWPAFWTLGFDCCDGTPWPAAGEIDIVEAKGGEPSRAHHAVHAEASGSHWHVSADTDARLAEGYDWTAAYHVYGIRWGQDRIVFTIDGTDRWTLLRSAVPKEAQPELFDRAHHLLLDLAVGGTFGGTPDPSAFPGQLLVDWVRVYQDAGSTPTPTPTPSPGGAVTIAAAGDIATSGDGDSQTAALLDALNPSAVLTLGDNAYPDGTASNFASYYDPTWGRHKAKTHPAPGNHDYHTSGASGYFNYFGAAAGDATKGYYSFDLGDWHFIALNTNSQCTTIVCGPGSPQEQWLRQDLAAHSNRCTLGYWHHPRWSRGSHGDFAGVQAFWQALYDYGADVVLAGHDHDYQRWAPLNASGAVDTQRGIRSFVAGTGGNSALYPVGSDNRLEIKNADTWGVLKLTLGADGYSWNFMPVAGKTFSDAGSESCH